MAIKQSVLDSLKAKWYTPEQIREKISFQYWDNSNELKEYDNLSKPTPVTQSAPKVLPTTVKTPTSTQTLQTEYDKLRATWLTKEQATTQIKSKLQTTPTTSGVSVYDKMKAQYTAPSNLKLTKIDSTVIPANKNIKNVPAKSVVETAKDIYQAPSWASYDLITNPDNTVSFISKATGNLRTFKTKEDAIKTINEWNPTANAKNIISAKDIAPTEEMKTELAWPKSVSTKQQKQEIVNKITKSVELTDYEKEKLDSLENISAVQLQTEEDNLRNYTAQLKWSAADIINLNNKRSLELQSQAQEQIQANKAKVDQATSIVVSQLWGRARALSQIIGKDWRPLDDASMIALMWETGVTAMQWIVDTKNKMVDANNAIKEKSTQDIFELEQKNVITKDEANKAIFALEYQSKLNKAKITTDFYNSVFWVTDNAVQTAKVEKTAIQDKIYSILTWAGFSAEDIWASLNELWNIKDPTQVYAKLYELANKPWSAVAKWFANAKTSASEALESKYNQELALKNASKSWTSSSLPKASAEALGSMKSSLQWAIWQELDVNNINDNYVNIYWDLWASGWKEAIIHWEYLWLPWKVVVISATDARRLLDWLKEWKFNTVKFNDKAKIMTYDEYNKQPDTPTKTTTTTQWWIPLNLLTPSKDTLKNPTILELNKWLVNQYNQNPKKTEKSITQFPDWKVLIFNWNWKYQYIDENWNIYNPTLIWDNATKIAFNIWDKNAVADYLRTLGERWYNWLVNYPEWWNIYFKNWQYSYDWQDFKSIGK